MPHSVRAKGKDGVALKLAESGERKQRGAAQPCQGETSGSFICTNINAGGRTGLSHFPETLLNEDVRIKWNNTDKVLRMAPGTKS